MSSSKSISKFTYNNVVKHIRVICIGSGGYEYIASEEWGDENHKPDFEPKSTWDRTDKVGVRQANKELAKWKKGIRKLIKQAKAGPGAINMMAKAYTGNGPEGVWDYFDQLYRSMSNDEIIEYGASDKTLMKESYVNGTIETWLE